MSSPLSLVRQEEAQPVGNGDSGYFCAHKERRMLSVEEVPQMFREPYIYSGYRQVDRPWSYYLKSIFMIHNESLNVWTHGLGFFAVLYCLVTCLSNLDEHTKDYATCVTFFGLCCLINLALSSIAHLFHSKSRWCHHAFLFVDYMGVSLFTFASGVVSMFVSSSKELHDNIRGWFLPLNVVLSCCSLFACVYAKINLAHNNSHRKAMILTGLMCQAVIIAQPTAWRLVECALHPSFGLQRVSHLIITFFMLTMCGVTFGCHVPESLWPGRFDVLGHGHQWFHVTAVLTMMSQLWAIDVHLAERANQLAQLSQPTAAELLAFFLTLVAIETATVVYHMRLVANTSVLTAAKGSPSSEQKVAEYEDDLQPAGSEAETGDQFRNKDNPMEVGVLQRKEDAKIPRKHKKD